MMRIGKLAQRTNIAEETLRFWEREGLITPERKGVGNYRHYSEKDLERICFILNAKAVGFTLNEIKDFIKVLRQSDKELRRAEAMSLAQTKLLKMQAQLTKLQQMHGRLRTLINDCSNGHSNDGIDDLLNGSAITGTNERSGL